MRKRMASGLLIMSMILAATLTTMVPVKEVKAAPTQTTAADDAVDAANPFGFEQQIKLDGDYTASSAFYVPSLTYEYTLEPVTNGETNALSYYAKTGEFPTGNQTNTVFTSEVTGMFKNMTTENGVCTQTLAFQKVFPTLEITDPNKVYRYNFSITGIWVEDRTGAKGSAAADLGFMTLSDTMNIYCDLYLDEEGHLAGKFWNHDGTAKVEGFSEGETNVGKTIQTLFIATDTGGTDSSLADGVISYSVVSAEVSTKYFGTAKTSESIEYTVDFANLPWWLAVAGESRLKAQSSVANNANWTETPNDGNDTSSLKGTLFADSGEDAIIQFYGLPLGFGTTMNASMEIKEINGSNDVATLKKYADRTYIGTGVSTVTSTSLMDFSDKELQQGYKVGKVSDVESGDPATVTSYKVGDAKDSTLWPFALGETSQNNIRFVMYDPTDAIVVGVAMDFLPGILMVGLALGGAITIGISRRRDVAF